MNPVKNKNNKPALMLTIIIAVLLLVFWFVSRNKNTPEKSTMETKPILVETITAVNQTIPNQVWASGTVEPYAEAQLAPRIMSTVTKVYVREGDRVRAGQVLARLESKDLSAQVSSAKASVASAESMREKARTGVELQIAQTQANIANAQAALQVSKQQLSMLKEGPRRQEKMQAQLAIVQAEAQYKNAENELARMTRLYNQDVIPKQRLESVQTQFDVAKAQLNIAKQQAEISEEGGRSQEIQAAMERVKQAEAALRLAKAAAVQNKMARKEAQASASMVSQAKAGESSAKVMLGYAAIISPIDGIVTARYVDPGDTASPGVPIIVVQDDSKYRLLATIASKDINSVAVGKTADLELGSDKRNGTGKIVQIIPASDPSTHKFIVKVEIPKSLNPVSGDFGRAAFTVGYSSGIILPKDAVYDLGGIINVFVAGKNNRTDMRTVRVGRTTSDGIEILTGLRDGDKVITKSLAPLEDDIPIEIEGSSHE